MSISVVSILPQQKMLDEKKMLASTELLLNLTLQTVEHFIKRQFKEFDANPGDSGCQMRAFHLRRLADSDALAAECQSLQNVCKGCERALDLRKSCPQDPSTTNKFFQEQMEKLRVSRDMDYLMRCRLLCLTKESDHGLVNGIIVTRTEISKLSLLSKDIVSLQEKEREKLVLKAAADLAAKSIERLKEVALDEKMLLPSMIRVISTSHVKKPIACLFSQVKVILAQLQKENALVAMKNVVKVGLPFHLFLSAASPDREFGVVPMEQIRAMSGKMPVIVFEGLTKETCSSLAEKVMAIGFSRLVLACSAQADPFEKGSKPSDVALEETRLEISQYQKEIGLELFLIDHVFCNSLEGEIGPCQ